MDRRTVLVASVAVPAHTYNATPFVTQLLAAGHRVLWYADRAFHAHIRRVGAQALTPSFAHADVTRLDGLADVRRAFADAFVGFAGSRAQDLSRVIADEGVEVLLTDPLAYGAGLAAELSGIPWASFGDGPLHYADVDTPPFGTGLPYRLGGPWRLRNRVVAAVSEHGVFGRAGRRLQRTRRELGLPEDSRPVLEANLSPLLHLQGGVPEFEYPRLDLPPHVHWVGALRPQPAAAWHPPAWWAAVTDPAARPIVLVSQGTIRGDMSELVVPTLQGLADLDVTVVATTGAASPAAVADALGGALPANAIVERFLPYDEILAHAACFVTNGGWTGVTSALHHGVPLVQAGMTEEKSDIGSRIAYSGVGVSLRQTRPSPQRVREATARVLGASAERAAARAVSRSMAAHDAGRDGAELVLALAVSVAAAR
ncbi:MAG: glycosyltransferase [Mobilicoccus sp.]|nr:glycosyltransferase [Mobilicoccus sp.]